MLTLADVVAIADLDLRTLVEPVSSRALRWVTTSELSDPDRYLEGGELLLTTGLIDQDWTAYVRRIDRAGVAALGFGTGLSHDEIPAALVAAAREAGLGLVAVPESTPFIAIGKAVAGLLAQRDRRATEAALSLQQELTRAISRSDGVARVLGLLGRAAGGRAGLVDASGRAVTPARFRVPEAVAPALATLRPDRGSAAVTDSGGDGTTVVQPVGRGIDGSFLVLHTSRPLDGVSRAVLVSTVALLAVDARRADAAVAEDLRLRDRAASLWLQGATTAARAVAELLPGAPTSVEMVRVLRASGLPSGARARLARECPDALTTAEEASGRTGGVGTVAVLVADRRARETAELLAGLGARIGIGSAVATADAAASDAAARTALARTDRATPVVESDRLLHGGGIRAGLPDHAALPVARAVLGDVVDRPDLMDTLHTYLSHLGHWRPAADQLGIHRNTLRKRMACIERMTGRSVDTAAARADLWVALEIAAETTRTGRRWVERSPSPLFRRVGGDR